MVKEGTSGWKKGLSFERAYAYQSKDANGDAHHLYRILVTRQKGLEIVCSAFGRTSKDAWVNAYRMLHEKGVMPTEAYHSMLGSKGAIDV
jgi:hypothetical protein